jgi:tetratricopeptide (TPR) repeat protein
MKIFLSYASEQFEIARSLDLALRDEGHTTFFDRASLPAGEAYNREIREGVEDCDLFLFLLSPEALSPGRYTLAELEFAQAKWPEPDRHVLPVLVAPTAMEAVPPYLKAVSILRPAGDVTAAVAAAVERLARPWWHRTLRRSAALVLLVVVAVAGLAVWGVRGYLQQREVRQEVKRLMGPAKLQQQTRNYTSAWDLSTQAASLRPDDDEVIRAREQLAMEWLRNIRVTVGKDTFTDIVNKVSPVLSQCAASAEPARAGSCLAHLGWADFLRSSEGAGGMDPAQYYRRALEVDPDNVYAHTMLAFQLATRGGPIGDIRKHFASALASNTEREFVRHYQISALLYRHDAQLEDEAIRVANEIRRSNEAMPLGEKDRPDNWRLWDVYYSRLINGNDKAEFMSALPAADHLATLRWLFPEDELPKDKHTLWLFMVATFAEAAGERAEAKEAYEAVQKDLARQGATWGPLVDGTKEGLARLSH